MNQIRPHSYYRIVFLQLILLAITLSASAQWGGGQVLGNRVSNAPIDEGATGNGFGNSRLQISNGISNGTIVLNPNTPSLGPRLIPGSGSSGQAISTFGSPGGGPGGGGNPPGGGTFNAPIDGGAVILVILGIGLLLQLRLRELKNRQHQ